MRGNVVYTDDLGRDVRDVTDYYWRDWYDSVIAAERCESNVFILCSAKDDDGEFYRLVYHWLRSDTAELCEVLGSESSRWEKEGINPHGKLFEQFAAIG